MSLSNSIVEVKYESTQSSVATGGVKQLQGDQYGNLRNQEMYSPQYEDNTNALATVAVKPLAVSTYSWTLFQNLAANATLNVKATPGNVRSVYCHNINAAARYIQLHNTATTPGGGAVPLLTFLVPASSAIFIGADILGDHGVNFSTGIAFAFSTTEGTYTAGTATDQFTHILYK